eukprot:TRINITY_DN82877_c0_g1_i1.p1 TRINITY_DN82877_c0_g1~~TRINITY_DN82877_c0_g1_i1.p1  ORF type:complete len:319 (-),score=106.12 TRINITY_DN82877_c0_g1_i1:123-1079(-)
MEVQIHPLVLVHIVEQATRLCFREHGDELVVMGCLLGELCEDSRVHIRMGFDVRHEESKGITVLNRDFVEQRLGQYHDVFPKEKYELLGYYRTGGELCMPLDAENLFSFKEFGVASTLVAHLDMDVIRKGHATDEDALEDFVKFYEVSVSEDDIISRPLPVQLAMEDSELVAMDHLHAYREGEEGKSGHEGFISSLESRTRSLTSALELLGKRVVEMEEYIQELLENPSLLERPEMREAHAPILRNIRRFLGMLSAGASVEEEVHSQMADVLLVSVLAGATRTLGALDELVQIVHKIEKSTNTREGGKVSRRASGMKG